MNADIKLFDSDGFCPVGYAMFVEKHPGSQVLKYDDYVMRIDTTPYPSWPRRNFNTCEETGAVTPSDHGPLSFPADLIIFSLGMLFILVVHRLLRGHD